MIDIRASLAAVAAVAAVTVTSCASSGPVVKATFDEQRGDVLSCLAHQHIGPTALYRPGRYENTAAVLQVLRYYTRNGTRPYCDGRSPSAIDREWVSLYVALGASPSHVPAILDAAGR